jgi:hypothetical protein
MVDIPYSPCAGMVTRDAVDLADSAHAYGANRSLIIIIAA